jgi:hypothetical protein
MPHFKCVTCKTRTHHRDGPGDRVEERCPSCGSALERAGDLAELVGFRAVTSDERAAQGGRSRTHPSLVDRLTALRERREPQAQARLDGERCVDDGGGAAAEAVALPRPETTC